MSQELSILRRRFYARAPTTVARELIGKVLVRNRPDGNSLEGAIVETEAYGGSNDPASHAYRGITKRNEAMFGEAGHAYVYFTYSFHHCLNFVTERKGRPSAVLIRAVEPISGLDFMRKRRKTEDITDLASGPGKICQAFDIDRSLNKTDVTRIDGEIMVKNRGERPKILTTTRIGIKTGVEKNWRFCAADSKFLSQRVNHIKHQRIGIS